MIKANHAPKKYSHSGPENYDLVVRVNNELKFISPSEWLNLMSQSSTKFHDFHKLGVVFTDSNNMKLILGMSIDSVSTAKLPKDSKIPNILQAKQMGYMYRKLNLAMKLYGGIPLENHRYLIKDKSKDGFPLEYHPAMKSLTRPGYYSIIREVSNLPLN